MKRLQNHAQGLTDDVRAWLELRFELAKIEFWERVNEQADQLVLYAAVGAMGAVGGVVMLLAMCFLASWFFVWLTDWVIGSLFLGFLLVALFFFTVAALLFYTKPRFGLFEDKTQATVAEERVMDGRAAGEHVAPGSASTNK